MNKKKTEKTTEPKEIKSNKITTIIKSETTHFVIGLISIIFAVYLLLAFTSFFFTGDADQSILDHQQPGELMQTTNQVKNYAGARGAQLAEYLINNCFGLASYLIVLFLAVSGMRLMRAYKFRIWKWFMSCTVMMIWFSITLGFLFDGMFSGSFIYPGGLHGYNVSRWIVSQIGATGFWLLLFVTAILFFVYLSRETIRIVRKALHPEFKRKNEEIEKEVSDDENIRETTTSYTDPQPKEVVFDLPEKPIKEDDDNSPFKVSQAEESTTVLTPANEEHTTTEKEITEELTFTIGDDHTEEDEAYKGPAMEPYNPRLDL